MFDVTKNPNPTLSVIMLQIQSIRVNDAIHSIFCAECTHFKLCCVSQNLFCSTFCHVTTMCASAKSKRRVGNYVEN